MVLTAPLPSAAQIYDGSELSLLKAAAQVIPASPTCIITYYVSMDNCETWTKWTGTGLPTQKDAGVYWIKAKAVIASSNQGYYFAVAGKKETEAESEPVKVTILKRKLTWEAPEAKQGLTYNGSAQYLLDKGMVIGNLLDGTRENSVYTERYAATEKGAAAPSTQDYGSNATLSAKNAGDYTVYSVATITDTKNYYFTNEEGEAVTQVSVVTESSIKPYELTLVAPTAAPDRAYDAEEKEIAYNDGYVAEWEAISRFGDSGVVTVKHGVSDDRGTVEERLDSITSLKRANAAIYTLRVSGSIQDTHQRNYIFKNDSYEIEGRTYGTVTTDGKSAYADAWHEIQTLPLMFESPQPTTADLVYNGQDHQLLKQAAKVNGILEADSTKGLLTIEYSISADGGASWTEYDAALPTAKNAGNYLVKAKAEVSGGNYRFINGQASYEMPVAGYISVSIRPATVTATITGKDVTYNGEAQYLLKERTLCVEGLEPGATYEGGEVTLDSIITLEEEIWVAEFDNPTYIVSNNGAAVHAGNYRLYATFSSGNSNYLFTASESSTADEVLTFGGKRFAKSSDAEGTALIEPMEVRIVPPVPTEDKVYSGEAQALLATGYGLPEHPDHV